MISPTSSNSSIGTSQTAPATNQNGLTDIQSRSSILASTSSEQNLQPNLTELPFNVQPTDSLLLPKSKIKNKTANSEKQPSSNNVSNKKKAQAHITTVSIATIIGAILAPLTAGASLIPIAFIVLYGSASAVAMYGGSQFFLDENKSEVFNKNKPEEQSESLSPSPQLSPRSSISHHNENPILNPDADESVITLPDDTNESETPENLGTKSARNNRQLINENNDVSLPDEIDGKIISENHNTNKETPSIDLIDGVDGVIDLLPDEYKETSIEIPVDNIFKNENDVTHSFHHDINALDNPTIKDQVSWLLDQGLRPQQAIVLDDNTKIYVISQATEEIPATHTPAMAKKHPEVQIPKSLITSQAGISGRADNATAGVRRNVSDAESHQAKAPATHTPALAKKHPEVQIPNSLITSQAGISGRADNVTAGVRRNVSDAESHQAKAPATHTPAMAKKHPEVQIPNSLITSQVGISGRADNATAGVRRNVSDAESHQAKAPATHTPAMAKKHPEVQIPKSLITSQAGISGRADNVTAGVRQNLQKIEASKLETLSSNYMTNSGMNNKGKLVLLNNNLAALPANLQQIDYIKK